jgi:hypothetical protein
MTGGAAPWHPPLSTTSPEAAASYLEGLRRHLAILPGSGRSFDDAHRSDPGFGVASIALAVAASGVGERALAKRALAAAREAAPTAPPQAASHIGAVVAILTQPTARALEVTAAHLAQHPADLFVLSLTLNSLHISARRSRRQDALELLDAAAARTDHPDLLGLRSVIRQDLGDLDGARDDALRALDGNARSGHAAHGLAHVHYETAEHEAGRAWLARWLESWDPRHPAGLHLSWHVALHELAMDDLDAVLSRFDSSIAPQSTPTLYVDAVDTLWRLRLRGLVDGARWAALRDLVGDVRPDRTTSLPLLHSLLVLAGSEDREGLARAVERVEGAGLADVGSAALVPIGRALVAVQRRDLEGAVAELEQVGADVVAVAASNAQLDVVSGTLLRCYRDLDREPPADVFLVARLGQGSSERATGAVTPRTPSSCATAPTTWWRRAGRRGRTRRS